MYQLTVQKIEKNPDYARFRPGEFIETNYPTGLRMPSEYITENILTVVLTDEEYQRVKQAVIESWK